MNINRNGIAVVSKTSKKSKRVPLDYVLEMIDYYRIVDGIECIVSVPKISHLRKELKNHGWRVLKNDEH